MKTLLLTALLAIGMMANAQITMEEYRKLIHDSLWLVDYEPKYTDTVKVLVVYADTTSGTQLETFDGFNYFIQYKTGADHSIKWTCGYCVRRHNEFDVILDRKKKPFNGVVILTVNCDWK